MIIDLHAHLNPEEWSKTRPPSMFDVEGYLAAQAEAHIDLSLISNPLIGRPNQDLRSLDKMKRFHEFAAELTAKYPQNLIAAAVAVPWAGDDCLEETKRAIIEGGCKAVLINPCYNGEYLDSERAYPFYQLMSEMDIPVFVHPPGETIGKEFMKEYRLVEIVGRPMETTLGLARMIYAGVLEKFPKLKVLCAHLGGAITILAGRINYGYEERAKEGYNPFGTGDDWGPDCLTKEPLDYIRMLYVDTVSFHQPGVMCALMTVGDDHVVFGTDNPPVQIPLERSIRLIENLPVGEDVKQKIFSGNAARLLKLE